MPLLLREFWLPFVVRGLELPDWALRPAAADPVPKLRQPSLELLVTPPPWRFVWLDWGTRVLAPPDRSCCVLTAPCPVPVMGCPNARQPLVPVAAELPGEAFPLR